MGVPAYPIRPLLLLANPCLLGRLELSTELWVSPITVARLPENGGLNVSQAINLGELYANLGKANKAAEAIARVGTMSPYGRMQLEDVKLRIAIGRHDKSAVARHMAYIREHRADAVLTWEFALLLHGDLDQAAALLIERLEKPEWRSDALAAVQSYDAPIHRTPLEQRIFDRMQAIVARPDVQAALRKVGRIEHVNLTPWRY